MRAFRTHHPTLGLKVCAGLLLVLNVQAAFEPFWDFEMQPALFQVARRGGQQLTTLRRD